MNQHLKDFPIHELQEKLLYWFERNMRDLPWRKDKDPYKVWVSEVMLQQTRVDTVVPYFNRFIEKYPDIDSLADASEEEVLKQWEGLGYYSRARNLQSAVQEVRAEYGGKVPDDPKQILSLKGVGPYIAGAILSIAYDQKEPAVDGNVMRVFSRIFAIEDDIQKSKTRKRFEALVRELIPVDSTSHFNQGIMELGALICTPKSPQCPRCPVNELCKAKEEGIQHALPVKSKKKKQPTRHMVAGVLVHQGHVCIRQREDQGLLARLFEFPNLEYEEKPDEAISHYFFDTYDLKTETVEQYEGIEHTFSHLIWDITVFRLKIVDDPGLLGELGNRSRWVKIEELDEYAFPVSHQKIKAQLKERGSHGMNKLSPKRPH